MCSIIVFSQSGTASVSVLNKLNESQFSRMIFLVTLTLAVCKESLEMNSDRPNSLMQ